jgi:LmbE family N-acetylglucosaminyl deacetylase
LKQCAHTDADVLFADRRGEDVNACALAGITPRHLGHVDALWRKVSAPGALRRVLPHFLPEFVHLYPTYRLHLIRGKVLPQDAALSHTLGEELKGIVGAQKEYVLFCPVALRSHIDHVIVRDVCLAHFNNVILWQDFPYNIEHRWSEKEAGVFGTEAFRWEREKEVKRQMMEAYTSQVRTMFPGGSIPLVPEVYYTPLRAK